MTLVLKFGGTSVGSGERMVHVANIIKQRSQKSIIVLSAMSKAVKSDGTTSKLLLACNEILTPDSQIYLDIINQIELDHLTELEIALAVSPNASNIRSSTRFEIQQICHRLKSFMAAAEIINEISPRTMDYIGVDAKLINLDKLIKRKFYDTLDQHFYQYIVECLAEKLNTPDSVFVVTGFVGPVPGGILETIGRGYTDLTAALIAVACKASELQIWKEVDGIFTADPRKVAQAQKIASITPEEAAELTYYGSEVIHPFTMEQVINASIPIRIKNTFNPNGDGTLITPIKNALNPDKTVSTANSKSYGRPTAVTVKENITVLNLASNRKSNSHGFLAKAFSILDKFGIIVDLISTSEVNISMAFGSAGEKLDQALALLQKCGTVSVLRNMAIISLVGREMKNTVGVSSKMFGALAKLSINIEMISQGASEINISCVIDQKFATLALNAIHESLIVQ